jgi:uncharacterized protein
MGKIIQVSCPVCATKVDWVPEQRFKPFCSERCKMIDLGDWATEAHKIPCGPVNSELSDDDEL